MPLTRLTRGYQVTIPAVLRRAFGLEIGDVLEVTQENARIVMTPKALVDKELKASLLASLKEAKRKGTLGPFKTATAAMRALKRSKA